jgi:subtilisin-like proprotein convertase family protein
MRHSVRRYGVVLCAIAVACSARALPSWGIDLPVHDSPSTAQLPSDTNELIVFLQPGTDVEAFSRGRGLEVVHALRSDPNAYVLAAPSVAEALAHVPVLRQDDAVIAVYPNQRTAYIRTDFVPDDPYFHKDTPDTGWPGQWHLINEHVVGLDARVQGAWERNITGQGVTIGIIDDCLETTHPDLQPNYVAADSWDFGQNDPNPDPVYSSDIHGIAVAGVAAARGGNTIGVTGAAPYAGLAGLRIDFQNQTTYMFVDATLYHSSGTNTSIKVKNHSYTMPYTYVSSSAQVDALVSSAAAGTVHCHAAGNERGATAEDANKKDVTNQPEAICVAAMGSNGKFASYSCFGACVFVTAPSSSSSNLLRITTTDRTGSLGYNGSGDSFPDLDYTSRFGGTSASSPLAAGVMALVKEVQPALDVRFAKHLLALTSTIVDPADTTASSDGGWRTNAAGFTFNQNYGFGLIHADALTEHAPLYSGVTPLATETTGTFFVNQNIPNNNPDGLSRTFNFNSTTPLEAVRVYLNISHGHRGEVVAYLTSPSGYTSRLMAARADDNGSNIVWTFTTNAFWGEIPAGTWTLNVRDIGNQATGRWSRFSVTAQMGQLIAHPCSSPPVVTAMDPTVAENEGLLAGALITGSNFSADSTGAKLTLAGEPDIVASNVNVISSDQMICDFDLDGVATGSWNLVVTKTDCDDAILSDALTVTLPAPDIPGDFDGDGDVDEADFAIFEACVTGPGIPYDPQNLPSGCTLVPDAEGIIAADFDRDGDVDQTDFGVFQRCWSGENNPADPACAN